jgi:tricorn protease-like protein
MACTPYAFAFDETTTAQTKKQLDGYISYILDRNGDIISVTYIGSKFLGHCKSEDLLINITEMFPEYELSLKDIVSVGIDGCATQKANFGRKAVIIEEKKISC